MIRDRESESAITDMTNPEFFWCTSYIQKVGNRNLIQSKFASTKGRNHEEVRTSGSRHGDVVMPATPKSLAKLNGRAMINCEIHTINGVSQVECPENT